MLTSIKQRLGHDDEQGFTLIELMVVVLIIAILLAIAIPTFLGARNTANARAAQSNLRNALTAEQTQYTNTQAFSDNTETPPAMQSIEPNLTWVASGGVLNDSTPNSVLTTISGGDVVILTAVGKDHNCYSVAQYNQPTGTGATLVAAGTYYDEVKSTSTASPYVCTSPAVPTATPTAAKASTTLGTYGLGW
ncbi:MAG TPA: prepilin-type N-terminal cleavage/methylation domain-containing protein [Acidimicrobiales bacterium]|nr:prepilin-type N-terminal cleavage/methylation domain-containing protein [Acidimicrobiales bacterium]